MRMLAGYFMPTNGEININGHIPFNHVELVKQVCFIEESHNFKENFRVKDVLKVASYYYPDWNEGKAQSLKKLFKLKDKQKVSALSKGMYSALGIIVGLSSQAPITIFDEPYIGLDASYRSTFYDLLLEESENHPRMFIISTHLIDEISQLFEEVVIMHEGEMLLHEKAVDLAEQHLLVSGKDSAVDQYATGKNVIYETKMFGTKTVIVYGEKYDVQEAVSLGLKVICRRDISSECDREGR
ncbi:ATP-binding cassette domain-containing protein [Bacillaceae bacterium W0354]